MQIGAAATYVKAKWLVYRDHPVGCMVCAGYVILANLVWMYLFAAETAFHLFQISYLLPRHATWQETVLACCIVGAVPCHVYDLVCGVSRRLRTLISAMRVLGVR